MKFLVALWDSKEGLLNEDPAHEVVFVKADTSTDALHHVLNDVKCAVWARAYYEDDYFEQFPRI